ncbi:hypothetical protein DFH07DRAFT_298947 [Mycena maculata]|uniref:3-carboxymuconate cyclase n=1 Tax=Mycena maculata TaxID=230809 RepID=A0AAD7HJF0_9AGAR|nr:hypothetical protein DFH07DRAFT_298947 [Mycena maculata]
MKSSILLALISALFSIALASCDTPPRVSLYSPGSSHAGAVGAAYFMTNEPTGNYLVSATIGSDGKLALYEAVYTEGNGAHGLPAPPGLDALFSQGSVGVSSSQKFVANVNAGSNTVSVFGIDESNPGYLTLIGKPVSSGGEFPNSLTINNAGNRVCVVNGGKINGVSCYTFNAKEGLTPIKNSVRSLGLNQTTPATGPPNTPSQIIFSPDEKQLIVSVKAGFLAVWDIDSDGSLSSNFSTVDGGVLPFSLIFVPGQNALAAADPGVGFDVFNLATKTAVSTVIPNQKANCWSTYSKESGDFYFIDVGASVVTEVHVSSSLNSTIVKQYSLGADGPIDSEVATVGKKDFMYTLAANATGLTVVSVNGPGKAEVYQRVDIAGPAKTAHLPINSTTLQGMATFIR